MFEAIKANRNPGIPVVELDLNINDPAFAAKAVEMMLELIGRRTTMNTSERQRRSMAER
jgi:uncharacterized protein (UPF0261 family)